MLRVPGAFPKDVGGLKRGELAESWLSGERRGSDDLPPIRLGATALRQRTGVAAADSGRRLSGDRGEPLGIGSEAMLHGDDEAHSGEGGATVSISG